MAAALLAAQLLGDAQGMDVETIIRRSQELYETNWKAAPGFDYFERDHLAGGQTRTYHVLMIGGSPYRALVKANGEPLPPDQRAQEQRKLEETIARRRAESPRERAQRIARYQKSRRRDHRLLEEFVNAFDFQLLAEKPLDNYRVYVIRASPKPGYQPGGRETEVLTGMEGELFIDSETLQWVKAEAVVMRPVWIEAFLTRVQPGTRFEIDYAPVAKGIWEPTHFQMRSRAKVLFLLPVRAHDDESYYGYEKASEEAPGRELLPAGSGW